MVRSRFAVRVRNVKSIADADSRNNTKLIQLALSRIAEVLARALEQRKTVRRNKELGCPIGHRKEKMKYQCYLCKKFRNRQEIEMKKISDPNILFYVCLDHGMAANCLKNDCLYLDGNNQCSISKEDPSDCLFYVNMPTYKKELHWDGKEKKEGK